MMTPSNHAVFLMAQLRHAIETNDRTEELWLRGLLQSYIAVLERGKTDQELKKARRETGWQLD